VKRGRDLVNLRVVAKLCLAGNSVEPRRRLIGEFTREEQEYIMNILMQERLASIKNGYVLPSRRLCELYRDYLNCYEGLRYRCDPNPFTVARCHSEGWEACLALLP